MPVPPTCCMRAVSAPGSSTAAQTPRSKPTRQRRRRPTQLPLLVPLPHLQPQHNVCTASDTAGSDSAQSRPQQPRLLVPVKPQQPAPPSVPLIQQRQQQQLLLQQQQQQQQQPSLPSTPAAAYVKQVAREGSNSAAAAGKPAWALSVDKRVAVLPSTGAGSARLTRWSGRTAVRTSPSRTAVAPATRQPADSGMQGRPVGTSRSGSSSRMPPGSITASIDEYVESGELSADGEQQLCLAYQRYLQLQQIMAEPHKVQALIQQRVAQRQQQQQQQQQQPPVGSTAAAGAGQVAAGDLQALLRDPVSIEREGLLAQELLLEMYEPLLINRVKRVQSPHMDSRELLAAARQGLLKAAARFDLQRVRQGRDRLYALADRCIKNALRDMLTEYQTAVVRVPTHVREEAAKLHRVKQRLQQKQGDREPSLEEVADAAGISLQRAQRALQATGGALQALSLQSSVSKDKEERGKAGTGMDIQQVDVSMEEDSNELSGVVGAGGITAARSGLHEELDAAAEEAAVTDLLQNLMSELSPEDRHLLQLKMEGGNVSQAARELGKSRQWGAVAVEKVVQKLREDVQQHAQHDAEVAALLKP